MTVTDGIVLHEIKLPVPGVKKKVLYQFSDVHLALHDDLSTPEEIRKAEESSANWVNGRLWFSQKYGEPDEACQRKSAREHFDALLGMAKNADAVILAGDICEYVSGANLRFLDSRLADLGVPFLAVCGNHDKADDIPEGFLYSRAKAPLQLLDLEDLLIIGLDDSLQKITAEQNRQLRTALGLGKKAVIVMHIPVMTEGNRELLLGCGEYFRLNHPDADEETLQFLDILRQSSTQIAAVLAGHLHFHNESEIAPGLVQYVSSQGILGNINRYEIGL